MDTNATNDLLSSCGSIQTFSSVSNDPLSICETNSLKDMSFGYSNFSDSGYTSHKSVDLNKSRGYEEITPQSTFQLNKRKKDNFITYSLYRHSTISKTNIKAKHLRLKCKMRNVKFMDRSLLSAVLRL